jgi:hypothetical protein
MLWTLTGDPPCDGGMEIFVGSSAGSRRDICCKLRCGINIPVVFEQRATLQ